MPALIGNLSRLLISNQAMTLEEIAKATEDDDAVTTGSTLFITQSLAEQPWASKISRSSR